ncbi:hypothetical protein Landi51_02435 [Colletotrichum acutatum]
MDDGQCTEVLMQGTRLCTSPDSRLQRNAHLVSGVWAPLIDRLLFLNVGEEITTLEEQRPTAGKDREENCGGRDPLSFVPESLIVPSFRLLWVTSPGPTLLTNAARPRPKSSPSAQTGTPSTLHRKLFSQLSAPPPALGNQTQENVNATALSSLADASIPSLDDHDDDLYSIAHTDTDIMGVQKKTRKFGEVKRVIGKNDARRKENLKKAEEAEQKAKRERGGPDGETIVREIPQVPSQMFFESNSSLVPPYGVLVDTSFFSRTVQMKLPVIETMMDCLYATCHPIVTDCVMAELEKLGPKFRLALRVARDPRFERHKCTHKGVYADDCLVSKVSKDRVYLVATNDKGLVSRLRRIPGVPIMKCGRGKYTIERLPDAPI